jgi:hypothetical protein
MREQLSRRKDFIADEIVTVIPAFGIGGMTAAMKIALLSGALLERERNSVSQAFEPVDKVASHLVGIELIQIEIAQIVVGNISRKHVIDRDQNLMGDGHCRPFLSASCLEAIEFVAQVSSFGPGMRRWQPRLKQSSDRRWTWESGRFCVFLLIRCCRDKRRFRKPAAKRSGIRSYPRPIRQ